MPSRYETYTSDCPLALVRPGEMLDRETLRDGVYGLLIGDAGDCASVIEGSLDQLRDVGHRIENLIAEEANDTPTAPVDDRPIATETACKAIETYRKLSPTMRDAVRRATWRTTNESMHVGLFGSVAWRTMSALEKRDIVHLSDNALTDFGRVVYAVAVTSEVDALADAGRQDAAALIAATRGTVISEGAALATDDDPATVAFRAALLDELHMRALAEDAKYAHTEHSGAIKMCATHRHKDRPAIAVHVYDRGQGEYLGAYQCRDCITCNENCDALGDVIEAVSWTPWCQHHADGWGPERMAGPAIALLDSDRYQAVVAELAEREALVARLSASSWLPRRVASYRAVLMDIRLQDEHDET